MRNPFALRSRSSNRSPRLALGHRPQGEPDACVCLVAHSYHLHRVVWCVCLRVVRARGRRTAPLWDLPRKKRHLLSENQGPVAPIVITSAVPSGSQVSELLKRGTSHVPEQEKRTRRHVALLLGSRAVPKLRASLSVVPSPVATRRTHVALLRKSRTCVRYSDKRRSRGASTPAPTHFILYNTACPDATARVALDTARRTIVIDAAGRAPSAAALAVSAGRW